MRRWIEDRLAGLALGFLLTLGSAGCLSPIALHHAVVEYDRAVTDVDAEMLLLNVARARHFHPIHFTAVSSVAATFDFRANAALTSGFLDRPPSANAPILSLGSSVAENPTITIIPIQGEEFTRRILTAMDENKLRFLFAQGVEPSIILRLIGREIILDGYGESDLLRNGPRYREEYQEFRRRILHLSSLNLQKKLYAEPIIFEEPWPVPAGQKPPPEEIVAALAKEYRWMVTDDGQQPVLSRQVIGRMVITNYDVRQLSNEERRQLHQEAQLYPLHYVLVDIRPGDPGGDYPLHGRIVLRSFNAVLSFLGISIEADPEVPVDKDPRTGPITRNPPWTILIEETKDRPANAAFAVSYENRWYSIREAVKEEGVVNPWNQDAFRILTQLFQMTVTDISKTPTPSIVIPK